MACCNFGSEDELFPFEEKGTHFAEGIFPEWKVNRFFKVKTKLEEITEKVLSIKAALKGFPEEFKVEILSQFLKKELTENKRKLVYLLMTEYAIPFLEKLVFFRINEPEGFEEVEVLANEILELLSVPNQEHLNDKIERALDVLISVLYSISGGCND